MSGAVQTADRTQQFPTVGGDTARRSFVPKQKVQAATIGTGVSGALVTILVIELNRNGFKIEGEEAACITTVVAAIATFLCGWITPPGSNETNIDLGGGAIRSATST